VADLFCMFSDLSDHDILTMVHWYLVKSQKKKEKKKRTKFSSKLN